jgi:sugar O-acyltransferase (sialic acid O-acetyltransferase NeuD family)
VRAKTLVYGSREFGHVVQALVLDCGREFAGFIDDWDQGGDIVGSAARAYDLFPPDSCEVVVAVGYKHLDARWTIYEQLLARGYRVASLVHPEAYVGANAVIADGAFIMARSVVDTGARVGALAVVWPGAVVNHDAVVGQNSFISPNATICGAANVGEGSFVGAGAVVVDHVRVAARSFIKAGSVYAGRGHGAPIRK